MTSIFVNISIPAFQCRSGLFTLQGIFKLVCASMALLLFSTHLAANEDQTLVSDYIPRPPGLFVFLDTHRLHLHCIGQGSVTLLFEAGLGGSSREWLPIQQQLAKRTRACVYDRAGYGWSDSSPFPRHANRIALETRTMLDNSGNKRPLILVGHSFGGFVMRQLATISGNDIVGMVLIDSSHENQLQRFETKGARDVMPRSGKVVISPLVMPLDLPTGVRERQHLLDNLRKNRAATLTEMALFRRSAAQVRSTRSTVDYPIVVLSRGRNLYAANAHGDSRNAIWQELQMDLIHLSSRGRLLRALNSGHHIHVDEPELVASSIESILDDYENNQL